MIKITELALVLILCLFPGKARAFDDLRDAWTLGFLYHYARMERSTLINSDIFQSRQGGTLQFEYEDQFDLFWRWYVGGDFTIAVYEAAASRSFSPREQFPWQLFLGTGFQLGELKSFEVFFGAGGSSESYLEATALNTFNFKQAVSARVHAGFSWRFLGVVGSSSKLLLKYSLPVTTVRENGNNLTFRGILDGSIRLRGQYDSLMSFYTGVRFEDYQYSNESVTYFTTRVYAGLGFHFK